MNLYRFYLEITTSASDPIRYATSIPTHITTAPYFYRLSDQQCVIVEVAMLIAHQYVYYYCELKLICFV